MFEENTAYLGGGIFSKDADVTLLAGATFSKNSAKSAGAAIYCDASSFDVKDVTFVSNKDAFGADTNFACSASTSLRCYIISANKQWNGMCDDKFTPVGGDSDSGINLGNLPIPTWAAILIAVGCLLFIGVIGFVLTVVVYRRCYGRDLLNAHRPVRHPSCSTIDLFTFFLPLVRFFLARSVVADCNLFCTNNNSFALRMSLMPTNNCGRHWKVGFKMMSCIQPP
jgi:predicted outer membrane repeat protein